MLGLGFELAPLFAQQEGAGSTMLPLYVAGVVAITYLLFLRPQKQQEQKRKSMLDALKKNDKIVTSGGIYGTVTSVDAGSDRVVVRIDDEKGVKVTLARSSVARVLEAGGEKAAES